MIRRIIDWLMGTTAPLGTSGNVMIDGFSRQDISKHLDENGLMSAIVCPCGLYRRDIPPETSQCICWSHLWLHPRITMCANCTAVMLYGQSSYASYIACSGCRSRAKTAHYASIDAMYAVPESEVRERVAEQEREYADLFGSRDHANKESL